MKITANDIDDEPISDLTRNFMEHCSIQTDRMFINPSEEGAVASSSSLELVDKKWITEQLSEMKEQLTKDLTDKIAEEMHKYFSKFRDENNGEDKGHEKDTKKTANVEDEKNEKLHHVGVFCDNCDCQISGIRYKCGDCEDFDLCEVCEDLPNIHDVKHVFLKIRYPLPPCVEVQKYNLPVKQIVKDASHMDESKLKNVLKLKSSNTYSVDIDAEYVCDETVPPGTVFSPGEDFVKRWKIRNTGRIKWDSCTTVRMKRSHPSFQPLLTEVAVQHLEPFEEGIVSVMFKAPKIVGYFNSLWILHHNDVPFGDELWCQIIVSDLSPNASLRFDTVSPYSTAWLKSWRYDYQQYRMKHKCKDKHKRKEHGKKKLKPLFFDSFPLCHYSETDGSNHRCCKFVASYTNTPNNTPLDLTPPKSPEPKELTEGKKENSTEAVQGHGNTFKFKCANKLQNLALPKSPEPKELTEDKKENITEAGQGDSNAFKFKCASKFQTLDADEKISFGSPSSSESDSEFVIIPMPKCFNLTEAYKADGQFKELAKEMKKSVKSEMTGLNIVQKEYEIISSKASENETDQSRKSSLSGNDLDIMKKASSIIKNVSQETGVPEHAENFILCQESFENYMTSNIMDLKNSPSSSSISIIDSSGNSSPTSESSKLFQINTNQTSIEKPEIVKPIIEISEAVTSVCTSGTFPKFPVEGIDVENDSTYNKVFTEEAINVLMKYEKPLKIASGNANSTVTESPVLDLSPPMQKLFEMGFCNTEKNIQLLHKHNHDIVAVIEELVQTSGKEWYEA